MSMPEIPKPNPDLTQEQSLNMILSSIALEEVALSHIMNAEGEKIQAIIGRKCVDTEDILSVNKSVDSLLDNVLQTEIILKNKMEKVLEHLSPPDTHKYCDCHKKCIPCKHDCRKCCCCCEYEKCVCNNCCKHEECDCINCCCDEPKTRLCQKSKAYAQYKIMPNCYTCNENFILKKDFECPNTNYQKPHNKTQILLDGGKKYALNFVANICPKNTLSKPVIVELCIHNPVTNNVMCCESFKAHDCKTSTKICGNAIVDLTIDVPKKCPAVCVSLCLKSPHELDVNGGHLSITEL